MAGNLENLYYNKIESKIRRCNKNEQSVNLMKTISALESQLVQTLDENQISIFNSFVDAFTDLASTTVSDAYANGFRQGTKFIKETLEIELPE